ncbi:MAG TPA: triose-phosphate isomerase [Dehalococcoidia bacterium]
MPRTPMIAGNWKMNMSADGTRDLIAGIRAGGVDSVTNVDKVVCPPFVYLEAAREACAGSSIKVGAQNMHWEQKGAFTGEVSPLMLAEEQLAELVIIGHSERRQYFCETDETVNKKLKAALNVGLTPIVCVGESGEQRQAGQTDEVLKRQVRGAFEGVETPPTVVVAYEPVWAIGTGVAATPDDAQQAIRLIRRELASIIGESTASAVRILYGGSATPTNIASFVSQADVDGGLVGGASLVADSFVAMVKAVAALGA